MRLSSKGYYSIYFFPCQSVFYCRLGPGCFFSFWASRTSILARPGSAFPPGKTLFLRFVPLGAPLGISQRYRFFQQDFCHASFTAHTSSPPPPAVQFRYRALFSNLLSLSHPRNEHKSKQVYRWRGFSAFPSGTNPKNHHLPRNAVPPGSPIRSPGR